MNQTLCGSYKKVIQRRAHERVSAEIPVKFYCCNTDYSGVINNISESGMFISTKEMHFPFDSKIELIIPFEERLLRVPVRVIRITKSDNTFNGLGVEVIEGHHDYLRLVTVIKSSLYS